MTELISNDLLSLITFLIPGFLAAWVYYGLTSHPKPSQFERIVQALVFTFIVQVLLPPAKWLFLNLGNYVVLGPWDLIAENLTSVLIAIFLGLILAYFTNKDAFHKIMRKTGFTTRTSHPSEWFYIFSEKVTFIILHLKDGRRLYGWPKEWPIEPGKGQFYIMLPSWILEDGNQLELQELDGILVNAEDVKWVEFMNSEVNST